MVKDGENPVDYDSVNNFAADYKDILEAIYELWSQTNKKKNRFGMFEFHIINDDLKIVVLSNTISLKFYPRSMTVIHPFISLYNRVLYENSYRSNFHGF